jgi:hypothetical protein
MNAMIRCLLPAVLALGASAPAAAQPAEAASTCQRACLEDFVNRYLAAMAAHQRNPALFASDVRFTENGVELPFGREGLWATASGVGKYKFYVPDTETQQVAFLGTMLEQAKSSATGEERPPELVGLALRLRILGGKIAEVEQIAARPDRPLRATAANAVSSNPFPATGAAVEAMGAPHPLFTTAIPERQRQSRADLVRTANQYFEAIQRNTGKGYYPFTADCLRYENGMVMAGPPDAQHPTRKGCADQLRTSLIGTVDSIRDRRFVAVDRERGIVFALAFFDHRPINWTWELGELFKIEGDKIRRVEAVFVRSPYGLNSGWSTYAQGRSEKLQDIR